MTQTSTITTRDHTTTAADTADTEVLAEVIGRAGVITLHRPRAMNALTAGMVDELTRLLSAWEDDPTVDLVIIRGAGERGLCAGGDIAALYRDAQEDPEANDRFFAAEYALNRRIAEYPKPYVALMDGIVLGGGVGVSAHGSHRIVTEDSRVGMPEVGIGFIPDVGGSWLLANAPDNLGLHLALTGAHVGPGEAIDAGLADTFVEKRHLDDLVAALADSGDPAVIGRFASPAPAGFTDREARRGAYDAEDVEGVLGNLDAAAEQCTDWAADAAKRIRRSCPMSLKVAFAAQRRIRERNLSLAEALAQELHLAAVLPRRADFVEGVRAQIIDKDRNPRWQPATLAEITPADVAAVFDTPTESRSETMTTSYENILTERSGRVLTVTLNRPKALNALNEATMLELVDVVRAHDDDPEVGCIVITGSEKAFAAGADIKEMAEKNATEMYSSDWFAGWENLTRTRTPKIAAVAGYALGGGCELAMMCDLIVAADTAKFGQPEVNLGVLPGMGGSQRLTRAIGKAKAMDLCLTGRMMDAEEAERSGLVARVVPAAELLDVVADMAATIASKSKVATTMIKEAVDAVDEVSLTQGIRLERRLFHLAFSSEDQKEGMAAFTEKRSPDFQHR